MKTIIRYEAPSYAEQETIILYDKLTHNYRITTAVSYTHLRAHET